MYAKIRQRFCSTMYDELLKVWKAELENRDLTELPQGFIVRMEEYLKKLAEESRMLDKKTAKASLLKIEERNVKRMLREIANMRYRKLMKKISREKKEKIAISGAGNKNLIKMLTLTESYDSFLETVFSGEKMGELEKKRIIVRFLKEIPEIIGIDMKSYGPYKPEDVASLPAENAEMLIKQGLAVEIETE